MYKVLLTFGSNINIPAGTMLEASLAAPLYLSQ
jgi:hypothetical protein